MPEYVVGVDAGATHTVAALARGEELLRTAVGDSANPHLAGLGTAAEAIARTIRHVLNGETVAAIAVGAAGAGREEACVALRTELTKTFPNVRVRVTDDARIALRAAIPHGDGIVVIAGTGSIAYAEIGDRRFRAGGYGYLVGDEGSGYAIGAAALRRLLHAAELRVPHDAMLAALATHLGANDLRDVLGRIYASATPVVEIAACAPLVLHFAAAGERSALAIVEKAADDVFALVRTLLHRIILSGVEGCPLALSGGLLQHDNILTQLLEARIAAELPQLRIVGRGAPAYLGALAEARRALRS